MSRSTVVRACSSGGQDSSLLATSGQTFSTNVTATTLAASALMGAGSSGSDGGREPLIEPLRPEELQHLTMTDSRVWTFCRDAKMKVIHFHYFFPQHIKQKNTPANIDLPTSSKVIVTFLLSNV